MAVREMPDFICDLEPHDRTTQHRDLHGRRWDWSDDDIRVERIYQTLSCTEVSLMPEGMPERHHFTIEVKRTAPDRFAVRWNGSCLNGKTDEWEYEHIPSERTDDWLADHRFGYDEALRRAREIAPKLWVNGRTVQEWMAYMESKK